MNKNVLIEKVVADGRIRNIAMTDGRKTLGELAALTELQGFNFGRKTHGYLKEMLACHGLVFRQETPEEILKYGCRYYEGLRD